MDHVPSTGATLESRRTYRLSSLERWLQTGLKFVAFCFAAFFVLCFVLPLLAIMVILVLPLLVLALPAFAGYRLLEARRRIREELPEATGWWDEDEPEPPRNPRCAFCGRRLKLRRAFRRDIEALCRKCRTRFALMVGSPERSELEAAIETQEARHRRLMEPVTPACAACGAQSAAARTWRCDFCGHAFCFACYEVHLRERRRWHLPRLRAAPRQAATAGIEAGNGEAGP